MCGERVHECAHRGQQRRCRCEIRLSLALSVLEAWLGCRVRVAGATSGTHAGCAGRGARSPLALCYRRACASRAGARQADPLLRVTAFARCETPWRTPPRGALTAQGAPRVCIGLDDAWRRLHVSGQRGHAASLTIGALRPPRAPCNARCAASMAARATRMPSRAKPQPSRPGRRDRLRALLHPMRSPHVRHAIPDCTRPRDLQPNMPDAPPTFVPAVATPAHLRRRPPPPPLRRNAPPRTRVDVTCVAAHVSPAHVAPAHVAPARVASTPGSADWFSARARSARGLRPRCSRGRAAVASQVAPTPPRLADAIARLDVAHLPDTPLRLDTISAPPSQTHAAVRRLRPDDWFSAEARMLRGGARTLRYPASPAQQSVAARYQHRFTPTDGSVRNPPATHMPRPGRRQRKRCRSSQIRPMDPPAETLPKTCAAPSDRDDDAWLPCDMRQLSLTSAEASRTVSRNRAAAGLLWVVLSAVRSRTGHSSHYVHFDRRYQHAGKSRKNAASHSSRGTEHATPRYGLSADDLVQEGALGLLHAMDRWDPTRGQQLSSYAYLCARYAMQRAVENQARVVRLPVHAQEKLRRVYRSVRKYTTSSASMPDSRSASHHMQRRSRRKRVSLTLVAREAGVNAKDLAHLLRMQKQVMSTDTPIVNAGVGVSRPNTDNFCLLDVIVDDRIDVAAKVEADAMAESVVNLIAGHERLTKRERDVLTTRYVLDSPHEAHRAPLTLTAVAAMLGTSRYHVRTAEQSAIAKLREDISAEDRDSYLEWLASM